MIDNRELKYWLAWNRVKEIGPIRFGYLMKYFSSLEEAWNKSSEIKNIAELLHISQDTWLRIKSEKQKIKPEDELMYLDKMKVKVITIKEKDYPELLKNIYDPPPIIYYRGNFTGIVN
ncbi:MAG: DNA-processing protein DprA, partial [Atribacterota bacterium]|nr:DNA-processing protein DprA [Atribacterota bacterium]